VDSEETKITLTKLDQFGLQDVTFAELNFENNDIIINEDIFNKNTLYCISPERTLIHAEEIKDLEYNYYLINLNLKINKYLG
jgi:hypothetical protein